MRIGIMGASCRFPKSNSPEELWSTLLEGKDCFSPLRGLDGQTRDNEEGETEGEAKAGLLAQDVSAFDAGFFKIKPKEAVFMDPQQRLLLEVVWEALEDAGINPYGLSDRRVSVFAGTWMKDYEVLLGREGYYPLEENFLRHYLGNSTATMSAKISQFFHLKGPNVSLDAACSSTLTALKLGCDSLCNGDCDLAIICGSTSSSSPSPMRE